MSKVVGFTRFSVVTASHKRGYVATRSIPVEEALKLMLDPGRLRTRLELFKRLPLAALAAQTDGDFTLYLLVSEKLPDEFREELSRLEQEWSFLEVVGIGLEEDVRARCRELISGEGPTTTFRLDDDDAVGVHHVADLRSMSTPENEGRVLSNPRGVYIQRTRRGVQFQEVTYPNHAYGIGYFSQAGATIFDAGSHSALDGSDIAIGSRPRAWVRTIHGDSDSGVQFDGKSRRQHVTARSLPEYGHLHLQEVGELLTPVVSRAGSKGLVGRIGKKMSEVIGSGG